MTRRLFLSLAAPAVFAQSAKEQRGGKIIEEVIQALGGEKFRTMQDRLETGRAYSFYRERLSGLAQTKIYTRYLTRPEPPQPGFIGLRIRQFMGKKDESSVLYLEDNQGWDITYRGARPIPEEDLKRFYESQLRNVFYILRMRMGEPGLIIEHQGTEVVDNQPADIIDITDSDNRVVTVWVHETTRLPIQQRAFRRQFGGLDEEVTHFSKYRDAGDGINWPYAWLRTRNQEKIFELFSSSVEVNQGFTDEIFSLSSKVKVLKKK